MNLVNGDSAEYWKSAREEKLLFQKCSHCGQVQFPPRYHCAACWQAEPDWIESSGRGTVESFTIVRRAPLPAFRDKVPYVVASVIVEEGPRMIAAITGDNALDVKIGDAVTVDFQPTDEGETLPVFRPL
ncbi:UNVERIFIED_ORG: hypothetical protein BCL66_103200 [Martelella mediterranea]